MWISRSDWTGGRNGSRVRMRDLGDRGSRNGGRAMVTNEFIEEGASKSTDDRASDVDPQLVEVSRRSDSRAEELRADLPGRIQGGAGDGADKNDDPVDDESNDQPREASWRTTIDRAAEDREHEDCRSN